MPDHPNEEWLDHSRDVQPVFLEVFCGTAGVSASFKRLGFDNCIAVDKVRSKVTLASVIPLDLLKLSSQNLIFSWIRRPEVGVFLSPPHDICSKCAQALENMYDARWHWRPRRPGPHARWPSQRPLRFHLFMSWPLCWTQQTLHGSKPKKQFFFGLCLPWLTHSLRRSGSIKIIKLVPTAHNTAHGPVCASLSLKCSRSMVFAMANMDMRLGIMILWSMVQNAFLQPLLTLSPLESFAMPSRVLFVFILRPKSGRSCLCLPQVL